MPPWIRLLLACFAITMPVHAAAPLHLVADYEVFFNGAPVGEMREVFEQTGDRYRIISETRATGVMALIHKKPARAESSGVITPFGLRPERFEAVRGKKGEKHETAEFDWSRHSLRLRHDGVTETLPLPQGTQDRLSAMYQFLFLAPASRASLDFPMTNGRKLDDYRYRAGTDSRLDTRLGNLAVQHLVKQQQTGEVATEIWLSTEHRGLPVRMRIVEPDGERYEQRITRVSLSP